MWQNLTFDDFRRLRYVLPLVNLHLLCESSCLSTFVTWFLLLFYFC